MGAENLKNQIDEQQLGLEALKTKLPEGKGKDVMEQYHVAFRGTVDNIQGQFDYLSASFGDDENIAKFIGDSEGLINSRLAGLANIGRKILNPKKPGIAKMVMEEDGPVDYLYYSAYSFEELLAQIKQELTKLQVFGDIRKDQEIFKKQTEDWMAGFGTTNKTDYIEEGEVLLGNANLLYESLAQILDTPQTLEGKNFVMSLREDLIINIETIADELAIVLLQEDEEKYRKLIESKIERKLQIFIDDENLRTIEKVKIMAELEPLFEKAIDAKNNQDIVSLNAMIDVSIEEYFEEIPFNIIDVEINGDLYRCNYDSPQSFKDYERLKAEAESTAKTYLKFKLKKGKERYDEVDFQFSNGVIESKFVLKIGNRRYDSISVMGMELTLKSSDPQTDEQIKHLKDLPQAFEEWRESDDPSTEITYGNPPQTIDVAPAMLIASKEKKDFTFDLLIENSFSLSELFVEKTTIYEYEEKDGKIITKKRTEIKKERLNADREKIIEYNGKDELLRITTKELTVHNREPRNTVSIYDYYTQSELPPGYKTGRKKIQEIDNGIILSNTEYNIDGLATREETAVAGCPGITSLVYANGGRIYDEKGNFVPEATRVMKDGSDVIVRPYSVEKKFNPDLTEQQYMERLATILNTDERMHAYINLMMQYTLEYEHGGEYWPTFSEMIGHEKNGLIPDDCDGFAPFLLKLKKLQGKQGYLMAVGLKHVEAIVLEKDSNGNIHATSYGTLGVDRDGNRIGQSFDTERAKGYESLEEALTSINKKWENGLDLSLWVTTDTVSILRNIDDPDHDFKFSKGLFKDNYIYRNIPKNKNFDAPWRNRYIEYYLSPDILIVNEG